jgi:hypothetical protein
MRVCECVFKLSPPPLTQHLPREHKDRERGLQGEGGGEREREREGERERKRESERARERESERARERQSERARERESETSRQRDSERAREWAARQAARNQEKEWGKEAGSPRTAQKPTANPKSSQEPLHDNYMTNT